MFSLTIVQFHFKLEKYQPYKTALKELNKLFTLLLNIITLLLLIHLFTLFLHSTSINLTNCNISKISNIPALARG